MQIEVRAAEYGERLIVRHLMELYQYDFSEFDGTELDQYGQYGYYDLDCFWINPAYAAYVVKVDGHWAGFALVNDETYLPGNTRAMLEFFIVRKYRKHGVGRRAAMDIFAMTPASWEIRVIAQNPAAAAFWQSIAGPAVTLMDNEQWQGPVFSIDNR